MFAAARKLLVLSFIVVLVSSVSFAGEPINPAMFQSSSDVERSSGNSGGWWSVGIGTAFVALGVTGLVLSGSAADDREAAEALGSTYFGLFLDSYALAAAEYALGNYNASDQYLSEAVLWASLAGEQGEIAGDNREEEGLWKGVAYASFAAGALFVIKGIFEFASDDGVDSSKKSEDSGASLLLTPGKEPQVGISWAF
jgi:hypothetical protein